MNLGPWKFFKQQPAGKEDGGDEGAAQDSSGTGQGDFDESADDEAAAEGERLLAEEGDETEEESESEEEEQSDEDQDPAEDDEEELEPEKGSGFKDPKTGNWDWQKITKAVGSPELAKTFRETQAQITRVSQENKTLREQTFHVPQLQQRAQLMDHLDQAFHMNPEFRAAAMKALGVMPEGGREQEYELPEGVNPKDPLLPLVIKQQRALDSFLNRQRNEDRTRQQGETKANFLQGLKDAQASFLSLTGRNPSEEEMRSVAEKMRSTGHYKGAEWVPGMFTKDIQEKARRDLLASKKSKRNLPTKGRSGVTSSKTQKGSDLRNAFEEAWEETM